MGLPGQRGRPVTPEIPATLVKQETPVIQARKERKETKATPGIPETQETLEMLAKRELTVRKVIKATQETPAKKAQVLQ